MATFWQVAPTPDNRPSRLPVLLSAALAGIAPVRPAGIAPVRPAGIAPVRPAGIVPLALAGMLLTPAGPADARTIRVPTDVSRIQAAVERAAAGDTIRIAAGTYLENVVVEKEHGGIVLLGEDGPRQTILDGGGQGRVLTFVETAKDTRVEGLTLRNGGPSFDGGGVYVYLGSVSIVRCRIMANRAEGDGGGISAYSAEVLIRESTIQANQARRGGGVHAVNSKLRLVNSTITGNTAEASGGGLYSDASDVAVVRNLVSENQAGGTGGGIAHVGSTGVYEGNLISRNASPRGGGMYCESSYQPRLTANMFTDNRPEDSLGCVQAP
jgi:hypothetical protein